VGQAGGEPDKLLSRIFSCKVYMMGWTEKVFFQSEGQAEEKMHEKSRGSPQQQFYSGPGKVRAWIYFEGRRVATSQLLKGKSENVFKVLAVLSLGLMNALALMTFAIPTFLVRMSLKLPYDSKKMKKNYS
jgi:hypothetical protein